ncbi:guanine nucleotide-binding protein G(i) subunit alpha [Acrasis kona]|uniref:Guanine nucleotide-binding protein G(I) subunit alpha n=1 Tax=Acrasis kona TaxID=1008807 RepID=A0AAW2Z967_9EUKA
MSIKEYLPCIFGGSKPNNNSVVVDESKNEIKVLLLGAGESGKSTIFKQMKIIHQSGFPEEERNQYKDTIYGNVVRAMKNLVENSLALDIPVEEPENRKRAEHINNMDSDVLINIQKVWTPELGQDIGHLWQDGGIKKTFERRNEFQLDDSSPYYFSNMDRISAPDYIPSQEDVLRSRVKTTGIVEISFPMGNRTIKMMDVGGQRNERKKWVHCFEGVAAIIFVINASEYDQNCYEDNETNRMRESLQLFEETVNSKWFVETNIIVFMNKIDLFREKIQKRDLTCIFEDYKGGCNFENAIEFMKEKFEEKNKFKDTKKVYTHLTCATDTDVMQKAFESIEDVLMRSNTPKKPL